MTWNRITRVGEVSVDGPHPEYQGRTVFHIRLSEAPPEKWAEYFAMGIGVAFTGDMSPPDLDGSVVAFHAPTKDVARYVTNVQERIESANNMYEQQELPRIQRQQEERRRSEDEAQRQLDEARKLVKDL